MRLILVDGFRGVFLVFMLIIHANDILKTTFGKLNHHYFGWVEDAQGFVFMSGLVVGLVYGGRYVCYGYEAMNRAIWARILTIYSHQAFLILLFLTITLIYLQLGATPPVILHKYEQEPVLFSIFSGFLVTGSAHMGILPMYIFFMMMTPSAFRLLNAQQYIIYFVILGAVWAFAQTRIPDQLITVLEQSLATSGHRIDLGIFFNALGWQALFFGGLFVGFLMSSKRLKTDFLHREEMRIVFFICVGLFFFFGIYDRIVFDDWFGSAFSEQIKAETDRGNFSTIYPITFVVDLLILVWLLGPGLDDKNRMIRELAQLLHKILKLRPLVFLGQHSLHVFSAHILIVYFLAALYQDHPPSELLGILLILLSLFGLYLAAWLHSTSVKRKKAKKTPLPKASPAPPDPVGDDHRRMS